MKRECSIRFVICMCWCDASDLWAFCTSQRTLDVLAWMIKCIYLQSIFSSFAFDYWQRLHVISLNEGLHWITKFIRESETLISYQFFFVLFYFGFKVSILFADFYSVSLLLISVVIRFRHNFWFVERPFPIKFTCCFVITLQ